MSSGSVGVSRLVGTSDRRLLAVGRNADSNSSGAVFAVKPANTAQDPESDVPPPTDEVVISVSASTAAATDAPPDAAGPYAEAALAAVKAARAGSPASAASETIPPAPPAYNASPAAQAAHAYAQTMQAWLESKNPRPAPSRRPAKANG